MVAGVDGDAPKISYTEPFFASSVPPTLVLPFPAYPASPVAAPPVVGVTTLASSWPKSGTGMRGRPRPFPPPVNGSDTPRRMDGRDKESSFRRLGLAGRDDFKMAGPDADSS